MKSRVERVIRMIKNILWVDNNNERGQAAQDFAQDSEALKIEWVRSTTSPETSMANCVAVLYHVGDIKNNCANEKPAWKYVKEWLGEEPSRKVLLFSGDYVIAENKATCLNQNPQSKKRWVPVSESINNERDTENWLKQHWCAVVNGNYHATEASLSSPCILAAIAVSLWSSASATERTSGAFSRLLKALEKEALKQEIKTMQSDTAPCQRLQKLVETLSQEASTPDDEATLRDLQQTLLHKIAEGKLASASTSGTHVV